MIKTITGAALAGVFSLGLAAAAQAQTIPSPTNPTPPFPVSTDGTPLPHHNAGLNADAGLLSGRSVFAPVGAPVGTGFGVANAVVDGTTSAVGVR